MANVTRRTPGVYLTELSAFPPSVVGVETAVPAFIGYTEKAEISGKPMFKKPIKLTSMADYEAVFGRGYKALYNIRAVPVDDGAAAVQDLPGETTDPGDDPVAPDPNNYDFSYYDTSVSPPEWRYYKLTDYIPIIDDEFDARGDGSNEEVIVPLGPFTEARFNLYNSMRLFYANGGGVCYVVSVGDYTASSIDGKLLLEGLDAINEQDGPTMLVIPDLVLLTGDDADKPWVAPTAYGDVVKAMLAQCANRQDRVSVIDVYGGAEVSNQAQLDEAMLRFRELAGTESLSYGMAYFPFLYTTVVGPTEINYQNIATESIDTLKEILDNEANNLYGGDPKNAARLAAVQRNIEAIQAYPDGGNTPAQADLVLKTNQNLTATIPLLSQIETIILAKNNVLPPSGAMAGIMTYTDTARGVWNAPANISMTNVVMPTYKISGDQQGDMNVPVDGKSIVALREFTGRGTVVWGARTLDGNSNDYRYIQVRRTLIYIEQSIKKALDPFVFAPNNGNTWATVVAMVSTFLQSVWSRGGLMGAKPSDAFSVACGIGSTMTAQDILDGYMRVQVVLQMLRPAEFIELTFTQKMEGIA